MSKGVLFGTRDPGSFSDAGSLLALRTNVTKESSWKMHQRLLHCTFLEDAFRFVRVKCHASGVLYDSKVLN